MSAREHNSYGRLIDLAEKVFPVREGEEMPTMAAHLDAAQRYCTVQAHELQPTSRRQGQPTAFGVLAGETALRRPGVSLALNLLLSRAFLNWLSLPPFNDPNSTCPSPSPFHDPNST